MSGSNTVVIDLTSDSRPTDTANLSRKRKAEVVEKAPSTVWLAIHQLESSYGQVGDFSSKNYRGCLLSHRPTRFDTNILGIYTSRATANRRALKYCIDHRIRYAEITNEDFVGEGKYIDGSESGCVHTFSERVFVQKQTLHHT